MATTVGIMSMQRIYNYGSSLQAYGLRRLIEGVQPGVQVSFIDFVPGKVLVEPPGDRRKTSRLGRIFTKVAEYNEVDAAWSDKLRFLNHKRSYGDRYFPLIGIPPHPNRDLRVDLQVIGSDEVFNCVQSNSNVGYSRDLFGHESPAATIISYAASFGNTTLAKIDAAGIRGELERDLAQFAAISVRDRNSAHIVEKLTGREPEIHLDPVLAYDFMGLESLIPQERQYPGKYIIVYGYAGRLNSDENETLKRYARTIGATILCFGGVQGCCDRFVDCSPFELLAYFRDAEAVVTDTFHGTIFSIINDRPFGAIIRPSVGHSYGNEEKLSFLLDTFGLADRRVTDISSLADVLRDPAKGDDVMGTLRRERRRTTEYLGSVMA